MLFESARHEPLTSEAWSEQTVRAAIVGIAAAARAEFDAAHDSWPMHPLDEPEHADERAYGLYHGTTGVLWALAHLHACGAIDDVGVDNVAIDTTVISHAAIDDVDRLRRLPDIAAKALRDAAAQHGTPSYLIGESAPLLLAWRATRDAAWADRLYEVVRGNLHNPALEALWGNPGTMLAAVFMVEAANDAVHEAGHEAHEASRWRDLLQQAAEALMSTMQRHPWAGHWLWEQDLYGRRRWLLGAAHGMVGNVFALLRASDAIDASLVALALERAYETLDATALRADINGVACANWPAHIAGVGEPPARVLVHDCHGAPGVVCRLAAAPRTREWDDLLRAAGELVWAAGPLEKGPSLCHGTAGSAMACLKLWQRFADERWLDRARALAWHAAVQVERCRTRHGMGRNSLWTGDLGVAVTLWNCIVKDARFPTLDVF